MESEPSAPKATILSPQEHRLKLRIEKRRGKSVSVVGPFALEDPQSLLTRLKKSLACGGSYKAPNLEFQGDVRERVRPLLEQEGFRL